MRVQDILNDNPIAIVPKVYCFDEVALKTFACNEISCEFESIYRAYLIVIRYHER